MDYSHYDPQDDADIEEIMDEAGVDRDEAEEILDFAETYNLDNSTATEIFENL